MSLLNLYNLREMARTRGDAMWAVLDWAAQQSGEFTYNDLYKVFRDAGGNSTIQQFHSMVKVAKPWSDDPSKQEVSEKRPFVFATRGRQGKGGNALLSWGLDAPLREPPQRVEPLGEPGTPDGDILDKLEDKLGRPQLAAAMKRWRSMTDIHRIAADIRATIPGRYQADALQVMAHILLTNKKASPAEVQAAEDEVQQAPAASAKSPPQAKARPAQQQPAAVDPRISDDDDDEDMGPGWRTLPDEQPAEPEAADDDDELGPGWSKVEDEPDEEPEAQDDSDDDGGESEELGEYPAFLPDPDEDGDKYERAMFKLVDEGGLGENDPIWNKLKNAKNDVDAHRIIKASDIPPGLAQAAIRVAMAIFDNTGRDWDTGKQKNESRFVRLYEISPLTQTVDFDQQDGIKRIKKTR